MSATLLHSPADVIRWLLIAIGQGTDPAQNGNWPVECALEPSSPDNCVTTYDTDTTKDGRSMVEGEVLEHYGVQVRVRAVDHRSGWQKAREIAVALDTQVRVNTVNITTDNGSASYTVWNVSRTSGPLSLGRDTPDSHRRLFTINAKVALRQGL